MSKGSFRFKQFTIQQDRCALKVGTDAVLFGAWVNYAHGRRILDIGTGTGVLALIAAQRNTTARIDAVEIDDPSAEQASENMHASPWSERLRVHRMDIRRLSTDEQFDLIICNPPYYSGYLSSPDPRIVLAKHSGELQFPDLVKAVDSLLTADGRFAVIIPLNREVEFLKEAAGHDLSPTRRCSVSYVAHRPAKRVLLELERGTNELKMESLTIEATGPFDYTPEYEAMISDLIPGF